MLVLFVFLMDLIRFLISLVEDINSYCQFLSAKNPIVKSVIPQAKQINKMKVVVLYIFLFFVKSKTIEEIVIIGPTPYTAPPTKAIQPTTTIEISGIVKFGRYIAVRKNTTCPTKAIN